MIHQRFLPVRPRGSRCGRRCSPISAYIKAGKVMDLTPEVENDSARENRFISTVLDPVTFAGKSYGVTRSSSP